MSRKICYVSGTRADFGLMCSTLQAIHRANDLELMILATGMHLSERYGMTVREIEAAGLPVAARIDVDLGQPTGATMAQNIGRMLIGFVDALTVNRPDLVLLLGDRGEMLAGALAAIHLGIPVAHIHGGERSGTVDEPVRHAISKLSHYHFVATEEARQRLVRMGELPENVWTTGAPGLDGIEASATIGRAQLMRDAGLDEKRPVALMVFHPVLQEAALAGPQTMLILDALKNEGVQAVVLKPNSDAGSEGVLRVLEAQADNPNLRIVTHFPRQMFISWMASVELMIGNSSAGIIEAASFGTQVINIGTRQNMRQRNANVVDVAVEASVIEAAIGHALKAGRLAPRNVYGDGQAAIRIVNFLRSVQPNPDTLAKTNAY